jgi:hypothetical protein
MKVIVVWWQTEMKHEKLKTEPKNEMLENMKMYQFQL